MGQYNLVRLIFRIPLVHEETFPYVFLLFINLDLSGLYQLDYIQAICTMIIGEHCPLWPVCLPRGEE